MTAVASYVPAIHEGYLRFFEKHPQDLYVLGEDLISQIPKLDRDIRALAPERVVTALSALGVSQSVTLLSRENLSELADHSSITLPNDSANHVFADEYLSNHEGLRFVDAFLRWDKRATLQQLPVEDEGELTENMHSLMELAQKESLKSPDWWRQVGAAVLTVDGIGLTAYNMHLPSPDYSLNTFGDPRANFDAGEHIELSKAIHAEAKLISQAARLGVKLEGATICVTTFPCPNCAKLIAEAGIKGVVYDEGYSLLDAQDTLKAYGVSIRRAALILREP